MTHLATKKTTTAGPPTMTDRVEIRAAAESALLTTYPASPTNDAVALGFNRAVWRVTYVTGGETSIELQAQGSADNGTTWEDLWYLAPQASGESILTKDEMQIVKGSMSGTYQIALPPMDCSGHPLVRLLPKYTGGSAPGSIAVAVNFAVVPVHG